MMMLKTILVEGPAKGSVTISIECKNNGKKEDGRIKKCNINLKKGQFEVISPYAIIRDGYKFSISSPKGSKIKTCVMEMEDYYKEIISTATCEEK